MLSRSQAMKKRWADPVFKEEMRKKLSAFYKGKPSFFVGKKHTEETKIKMAEKRKIYYSDPENRKKQGRHLKGKKQSSETVKKRMDGIKKWWRESPLANERRKKIIERITSKEHRDRVSKALKGKPKSKEHSQKVSESLKIKWSIVEYREKMLKIHRTPEIRAKRRVLSSGRNNAMFGICGDKSPNWQGGISLLPYGFEFDDKLKTVIKQRDSNTCQNPDCGKKFDLSVHHIDYDKKNNDQSNLITLCRKCNAIANFNRESWTNIYNKIISKLCQYNLSAKGI